MITVSIEDPVAVVVYDMLPLVIYWVVVDCGCVVVDGGTTTVTTQGSDEYLPLEVPTAVVCVAEASVVYTVLSWTGTYTVEASARRTGD